MYVFSQYILIVYLLKNITKDIDMKRKMQVD